MGNAGHGSHLICLEGIAFAMLSDRESHILTRIQQQCVVKPSTSRKSRLHRPHCVFYDDTQVHPNILKFQASGIDFGAALEQEMPQVPASTAIAGFRFGINSLVRMSVETLLWVIACRIVKYSIV